MEDDLVKNKKFILYPKVDNPVFIHDDCLREIINSQIDEHVERVRRELNGEDCCRKFSFFSEDTPSFSYLKNLFGRKYDCFADLEKRINSNGLQDKVKRVRVLYEPKGDKYGVINLKSSGKTIGFGNYVFVNS